MLWALSEDFYQPFLALVKSFLPVGLHILLLEDHFSQRWCKLYVYCPEGHLITPTTQPIRLTGPFLVLISLILSRRRTLPTLLMALTRSLPHRHIGRGLTAGSTFSPKARSIKAKRDQ